MKKRYKNKKWLYENYTILRKSVDEMASLENISRMTILRWLKKRDIKIILNEKTKLLKNKKWLLFEYINNKKSAVTIGKELMVSNKIVYYWLKKHEIKIRDRKGRNNPFFGKRHSDEIKEKMSKYRLGKGLSNLTKEKISKANLGKLAGEKNPAKRPEVRDKISQTQKQRYKMNPNLGRQISDRMKKRLADKKNHPNHGNKGPSSFGWKDPKNRKTTIAKRIRGCDQYFSWRKTCFERDQYTCQNCGIKNVYLEVDHIVPLCFIISSNDINQENLHIKVNSCIKLWDLSNGRTLCKKCHKNTPTYGLKAKLFISK